MEAHALEHGHHHGPPEANRSSRVDARELRLPFVRTFADVPVGSPLLYVDSRGRLALAVNQGNFAARHAVTPPAMLFIPRRPR